MIDTSKAARAGGHILVDRAKALEWSTSSA